MKTMTTRKPLLMITLILAMLCWLGLELGLHFSPRLNTPGKMRHVGMTWRWSRNCVSHLTFSPPLAPATTNAPAR